MADFSGVPLSVLDIAPRARGAAAEDALRDTLDLARQVERLGYRRFWFSEHHGTDSLAASAPAVLAAGVAAVTSTLRVGAGGASLANHRPLVVAEQFGTVAALYPGRVDLGLSPGPGTYDPQVAALVRAGAEPVPFEQGVRELLGHLSGEGAPVTPEPRTWPPVWILGSTADAADLAGRLGLPFVFGYHFSSHTVDAAVAAYRNAFRPSARLARPYLMLDVLVVLADTDEEAEWHASSLVAWGLEMSEGRFGQYLPPAQALAVGYPRDAWARAREQFAAQVVGGPKTAREKLAALVDRAAPDELMALTIVTDHAARTRSYELLADIS
jgi:luciferase family oxidoreductase group 1